MNSNWATKYYLPIFLRSLKLHILKSFCWPFLYSKLFECNPIRLEEFQEIIRLKARWRKRYNVIIPHLSQKWQHHLIITIIELNYILEPELCAKTRNQKNKACKKGFVLNNSLNFRSRYLMFDAWKSLW